MTNENQNGIKVLAQLDGYTFKTISDGDEGFDSLLVLPITVDADNIAADSRGPFVNMFDGNAVDIEIESHSTGKPKIGFSTTLKGHTLRTVKESADRYVQVYKFNLTFPAETIGKDRHVGFLRACSRTSLSEMI